MGDDLERRLVRRVSGELSAEEQAQLAEAIRQTPEAAVELDRLDEVWSGLELPPPAAVPPGFSGRVLARALAAGRPGSEADWSLAPGWARIVAVVALVAGLALGIGLGTVGEASGTTATVASSEGLWSDPGDGEAYWQAVGTDDTTPSPATPESGS
jgi:anti-sigma-K factor RskA